MRSLKDSIIHSRDFYLHHSEEIKKIAEETEDAEKRKEHLLSAKFYEGKAKGFQECLEFICGSCMG